jgi:hypothetical protein
MTPLDIRLQLHRNGYAPLPLVGKAPVLKNWQQINTTAREIELWPLLHPGATNTGVLTRLMPTLDLDILNEEAANAAEQIVRRHYGPVLVRIGRPPKRAIPFRTDVPFKKLCVAFGKEKVEFLCDGQQVAVAGMHPDTHQPYRWHGGDLWQIPRQNLPTIHEVEAPALVGEIVEVLCREHGYYQSSAVRPQSNQTPIHVSQVAISKGDRSVPKPLYNKIIELMPGRPLHQRRVRGILRPAVEAREDRNDQLYYAALQFRELILSHIITRDSVEKLLFMTAELSGYLEKRGKKQTEDTIRSGLNAWSFGRLPEKHEMGFSPDEENAP